MENIAIVSQVGFTMAGSILFCLAVGYMLDKWLGTRGIFTIIFIILGIAGGGVTVYRQITQIVDVRDKRNSSAGKQENGRD